MANSTLILDYIGYGTHAARPSPPLVASGVLALYFETDTAALFGWTGAAWAPLVNPGAGGTGSQTVTTATATVTAGGNGQMNIALQHSVTLTIASGSSEGQNLLLRLAQDGSGNRTVAFDASVAFGADIPSFTASTGASKVDFVGLRWDVTRAAWLFMAANRGF